MKMASDPVDVVTVLKSCIARVVERASLVIWPTESLDEADTRLHLSLVKGDQRVEITLRTAPDGQTPAVEIEQILPQRKLTALEQRRWVWRDPAFWAQPMHIAEVFDVEGHPDFEGVIGATIADVGLLHFLDEPEAATGLKLVLSSGRSIYSVPGTCGNRIVFELGSWAFPAPVGTKYLR